jgi:type II secretory pathway pseudopilin PulG
MQVLSKKSEAGVSLMGLIFVLVILGVLASFALKVLPSYSEFSNAKKGIVYAKNAGQSPADIRTSFDKQAEINDIKTISGKDLEITRRGEGFDVGFAYEKRIPLAGPVSLLIDYTASTGQAAAK